MILVRYTFQAQFGKAQDVVNTFNEGIARMRQAGGSFNVKGRLLTDLSGNFDTVVQELEFESLEDWMKLREAMFASEEWAERQQSATTPPILSGSAELFTIEAQF